MRACYLFLGFAILCMAACTQAIQPEELYGHWRYEKVEHPNQGPEATTPDEELKEHNPSITFSESAGLKMIWGGEVLSSGKFKTEGSTIVYTENLAGGKQRDIRFLVKKLEGDLLVFQTMEADAIRVTARKVQNK